MNIRLGRRRLQAAYAFKVRVVHTYLLSVDGMKSMNTGIRTEKKPTQSNHRYSYSNIYGFNVVNFYPIKICDLQKLSEAEYAAKRHYQTFFPIDKGVN